MAANMYVLWSFSTSAVSMLGREQFVAVYLSAGESGPQAVALNTTSVTVTTQLVESTAMWCCCC